MRMPDSAASLSRSTHVIGNPGRFLMSEQLKAPVNSSNSLPPVTNTSSSQFINPSDISYRFNGSMAIIIVVIIVIFLLMSFFVFYLKTRRSSPLRAISLRQQRQVALGASPPFPGSNGLSPEMVEEFPLVRYGSAKHAHPGRSGSMDCAVCLTEFHEDEKLRVLPKCGHFFHADCIESWLHSHNTCPLCRINLAATEPLDDPITIIATQPDPELHNNHAIPHHSHDHQPQSALTQNEQIQGLVEPAPSLHVLSETSESFPNIAAESAEHLPLGLGVVEWSRSGRGMRRSVSMEPHQLQLPTFMNKGEVEAGDGVRGKVHIRYGSFSSSSEQIRGSARSTSINKRHTFSMPESDSLPTTRSERR